MKLTISGRELDSKDDGVTHINIYSNANTALGKWLSAFTKVDLETEHGYFASLEAYYHWLKIYFSCTSHGVNTYRFINRMDKLRPLHGVDALRQGRECRKYVAKNGIAIFSEPTMRFKACYLDAIKRKLTGNPQMLMELQSAIEDGLPIVHYYDYGSSIVHQPWFNWSANIIVEAANALRSEFA